MCNSQTIVRVLDLFLIICLYDSCWGWSQKPLNSRPTLQPHHVVRMQVFSGGAAGQSCSGQATRQICLPGMATQQFNRLGSRLCQYLFGFG